MYQLNPKRGTVFILSDGREVPTSAEDLWKMLKEEGPVTDDWYVTINFRKAQPGDPIVVRVNDGYAKSKTGIVGFGYLYAVDPDAASVEIKFDMGTTRRLMETPIPLNEVRRVIPKMQNNIGDITKYRRYIDQWIFEDLRKGGALLGRTQSTIHREGKWTDISEKGPVKAPKAGTSKSSPEEIAQMREQANTQHRRLLIMLKNRLLARGWEKIGQKTGSVDMRATKGKTVIFFEAKTIQKQNESRQIRLAVGQLLEYRFIHGTKKEHLCMALNHEPDKSRLGFLDSLSIGVIWRVGSGFHGNGEAKRVLKDAVK